MPSLEHDDIRVAHVLLSWWVGRVRNSSHLAGLDETGQDSVYLRMMREFRVFTLLHEEGELRRADVSHFLAAWLQACSSL